MTDPIADMLTRVRNALRLKRTVVELPFSKAKFALAKVLESEGWIASAEKVESRFGTLRLTLRYDEDGSSFIHALKRVSKPGRRVYVQKDNLPIVLSNYGVAIISTSSGLMTNKAARKKGVGGEVICEIS